MAWGVGNQLVVHTKHGRRAGQGRGGSRAHEVRWETTLYEPVFRKLVNESLGDENTAGVGEFSFF